MNFNLKIRIKCFKLFLILALLLHNLKFHSYFPPFRFWKFLIFTNQILVFFRFIVCLFIILFLILRFHSCYIKFVVWMYKFFCDQNFNLNRFVLRFLFIFLILHLNIHSDFLKVIDLICFITSSLKFVNLIWL